MKAGIWLRVSTDEQDSSNQRPDIDRFAAAHGHQVERAYEVSASAWSGKSGEYSAQLKAALGAAWRGEFQVLIVWSLDRLTRHGAEDALRLIRLFRERGCTVVSVQESWLNGSSEVTDLLVAFAGWQARLESQRRSERIKAGNARRKAAGLPVGRQPGAKDRKARQRAGYVARYDKLRAAS